jgi:predicted N-formylglutamate amidohydrolase
VIESRPSIAIWPIAWRPEGCSSALSDFVLLTCEHGGNRVPAAFRRLFDPHRQLLNSHRGYDPGALELARVCARHLTVPLHFATVTRLLVELNRSLGHPALFSVVSKSLNSVERASLLETYYFPYRSRVEAEVAQAAKRGRRVIHVSFHTFTPQMDGVIRNADVGLLYDPRRPREVEFSALFKQSLAARRPGLTIRKNYPYLGKSDGFTTSLRKKWGDTVYLGIELEVNQRWPSSDPREWRLLQQAIAEAARETIACFSRR